MHANGKTFATRNETIPQTKENHTKSSKAQKNGAY